MLFTFIGGLGLLLFGMDRMSDGLRKAAGKKARQVLELLTSNVTKSVTIGALVTCIIQSSSATTVMVVGFVNAGLMKLRQAIGTIMGANIGTTITAWLISIFAALKHAKISIYGLPMVGIGFIASEMSKSRGSRHWWQVLLGLGLIILGLGYMKEGFGPLTEHKGDPELIVREVVDWPSLCKELNWHGSDRRASPGAQIWALLSPDAQKAIQKAAQVGDLPRESKVKIVQSLNGILPRRDLYDEDAFSTIVLPDDAKLLLRRGADVLSEEEVRILNRLLLEAAYPQEIAKNQGSLQKLFARFAEWPLVGFLVGAAVTAAIQSSSAAIGIIQILAATGVISLGAAIPLVLGTNVGTCVTAYIASFGTNTNARRAARAHLTFNCFGLVYLAVLGPLAALVRFVVPGELTDTNIAFHIAVAHTTVNVLSTLIFMPFVERLESFAVWLVPGDDDEVTGEPRFLEMHLLDSPPLALDSAKMEIHHMVQIAAEAMERAMDGFANGKGKSMKKVEQREEAIDQLQSEITEYLVEISRRNLEPAEASELPTLIHVVNDIERIGDHAVNIVELAATYRQEKLTFSKAAGRDLRKLHSEVAAMMADSIAALSQSNLDVAKTALKREKRINKLQMDCRKSHAARLTKKRCSVPAGLVFQDLIANLEKIGDHLANINQAVLGAFRWGEKFEIDDEDAEE